MIKRLVCLVACLGGSLEASQTISIDTNSYSSSNGFTTTSSSTYVVNLTSVTFGGLGQPVTSTSTVITAPVIVTGSTVGVVNGGANLTVQPGNTQNTTAWLITHGGIGQQTTSTSTVVLVSTVGVVNGGSSFTSVVTGSTVGIVNGGSQLNNYITNITTVTHNGIAQPVTSTGTIVVQSTVGVVSASPLVVTGSTVGVVIVNSTTSVIAGHLVSSTALSVALPQGATNAAYIDSIGRQLVTGLPYGIIRDTWNVLASTGTGEMVMVSSPAAPTRTFLCGCVFTSTGALNGSDIVIYSPTSASITSVSHPVGFGNMSTYVLWPGCSQPFMWGPPGGQVVYKPSGSVVTIKFHCQYYQGP